MSLHVMMILSGLLLVLSGLGTMVLQHKEPLAPPPISVPERPRYESWGVFVRIYIPVAESGRLEKVGGFLVQRWPDKAEARQFLSEYQAHPDKLDAHIKNFLVRDEYPENAVYAVEVSDASGPMQTTRKYRPPLIPVEVPLTESPQ